MRSAQPVLSACPSCKVEAALLELFDPEQRVGVALESQCRLCGYQAELGEVKQPGAQFGSVFEVMAALDRWAEEDREEDVRAFTIHNFQGMTPEQVADRILAGLPVETGFDVIAWLFPSSAMAMGAGERREPRPPEPERPPGMRPALQKLSLQKPDPGEPAPIRPQDLRIRHTRSADADAPPPPTAIDPLAPARALVSVMMADGQPHPAERRAVEALLKAGEHPALPEAEWRVYRPQEAGNPKDAAAIVAGMRRVAMSDGVVDGSEVRVIREYARAWQIPFDARTMPRGGTFEEIRRAIMDWLS